MHLRSIFSELSTYTLEVNLKFNAVCLLAGLSMWDLIERLFIEANVTVPFSNTRTLKFKAQPTNAFFATVNQMFGGSSQLPTTTERMVIKSLCTVQTTKQRSAVVLSWEEPPSIWLTAAKNAFVGRPLNFQCSHVIEKSSKIICSSGYHWQC